MSTLVNCIKLKKEAEGLSRPPIPGELGRKVQKNVSKEAWSAWVGQQTILINEYRLNPIDPKAKIFLNEEMEKYFFSD